MHAVAFLVLTFCFALQALACEIGLAGRPAGVAAYVEHISPCLIAPPAGIDFDTGLEAEFLVLINAERRAAGLAPVVARSELRDAARFQSLDMAANGFFAHEGLDGRSPSDRIAALDRTALTDFSAENLATVSKSSGRMGGDEALKRMHRNLMNSPSHRANILSPRATHVAVGVARTRGGVWVTQLFMNVSGTLPEAAPLRMSTKTRLPRPRHLPGWTFVRYDLVLPEGHPVPDSLELSPGSDARVSAYAKQPGDDEYSFFWIRFLGPAITVTP